MKIPRRYKNVVFAALMSFLTGLIVSGILTALHVGLGNQFINHWLTNFIGAWPIIFISIWLIAPRVLRFVDCLTD
jgi:hypothetical protein